MKKIYLLLLTTVIFLLISTVQTNAQQWTNEQKDVWAGVEKYWSVAATGDAQAFLAYFDDSYKGWDYSSKVPQSKANTGKWIEYGLKNYSNVFYTLTPVAIWVKGDFAYADYFYDEVVKNNETGKNEARSGKWTDILMKKDGKWVIIGDHGGRTSKEKE